MGRIKTLKINFSILMLLFILITFLTSCTKDKPAESPKSNAAVADLMASMNIQHFTKSATAPDFELLSVKGEKVSLSQYRGKVVLLSFWATW